MRTELFYWKYSKSKTVKNTKIENHCNFFLVILNPFKSCSNCGVKPRHSNKRCLGVSDHNCGETSRHK